MKFVPLHVHSHYSLLDGLVKIDDLIAKAKADNMEAIALTDHGSMYGIIEFYQKAHKAGIKPILGVEAYVAPYGILNKRSKIDEKNYHLVLLAENNTGYQNLLKLVSKAYLDGFYYKPRIDMEVLERYSEGLIALSACIQGEVANSILTHEGLEKAEEVLEKYIKIFGKKNFYIELQDHPNEPKQTVANKGLIELAQKHDLKCVATNDTHYLNTEDAKAQDILLCIQTNRKVEEKNRMTMMHEDFSLKNTKEMIKAFKDYPEAILNTTEVANRCNVELKFGQNVLPHFEVPEGQTDFTYLEEICYNGLAKRYGGEVLGNKKWEIDEKKIIVKSLSKEFTKKDILERLDYELAVIKRTGYASYFLITADFINWAKENGIVVGPGRGSAAGSIVAYLTKITNIEPLTYDLLFERFLNPDRISMPDIDTDFADTRRDEVIRYVENKYGKRHVSQIITFGTMAARGSIRDVGRALDISYGYCDKIAKMIPMGMTLDEALEKTKELKLEYRGNAECKNLIDFAKKLEGVCRHASTHACGVLITPEPLTNYVPLQYSSSNDKSIVSQYSLHPVEDLGLLKMDFLGLRNLTIIENSLETIDKIHHLKFDIDELALDDKKTFDILQKGNTTGVFQLESSGMKKYLKKLKPSEFEDIVAMVSLYRPGPLNSGMVDEFIDRKHGKKEVVYDHPIMENSLKNTYGVIVYQEQVMQLSKDMAGFTGGQADTLRKAMGKKIAKLMEKMKKEFIQGCEKNKISKEVAKKTFTSMEKFAEYGFNKSHAACYAMIAYQTAYLKSHYPAEFMASLLTSDLDNIDRIALEVNECRNMGIEVLPPDINESYTRFTVVAESLKEENPRIRFGLSAIKNVGMHITKAIIHERKEGGEYKSLEDFLSRIKDKDLNKKSIESLIKCGALDAFGDRNEMLMNIEKILSFIKAINEEAKTNQENLFALTDDGIKHNLHLEKFPPTDQKDSLIWEKELLGLYLSDHPFSSYQKELEDYIISSKKIKKGVSLENIRIAGVINSIKKIITKKGDIMLFVSIEDVYDRIEIIVFPSVYSETKDVWVEDNVVIVSGTLSQKEGENKVICNEVKSLSMEILSDLKQKLKRLNVNVTKQTKNLFIFFKKVVNADTISKLNSILNESKGGDKVFLAVPIDETRFRKIETNYFANFEDPALQKELNSLTEVRFVKMM